jgi:GlcNAc-P-P-Und epimerase
MKILVTGASGLIGRWLVDRLMTEGVTVVGLDVLTAIETRPGYTHFQGSILDRSFVKSVFAETAPNAVVHLAARVDLNGARVDDYPENVQGVENLIAAVQDCISVRRVIYTSSQLVCRVGYVPRADTEYCPDTPYGESKVMTEQIVRQADGGGREWVICRPTTVWGPYMNVHYQRFLQYISVGRYCHITRRQLYKTYGYVGNVAWQYYKFLTAPSEAVSGKTFYVADYEPISLREYADGLQRQFGARAIKTYPYWVAWLGAKAGDLMILLGRTNFPVNSFRLHNIMTEYRFDMESTRLVCGELPYRFIDGVIETANWYRFIKEGDSAYGAAGSCDRTRRSECL